MRKLRVLLAILLLFGVAFSPVLAANLYWKTTLADLNAIPGASDGDRGLVIGAAGDVTFYLHTGGLWIPATATAGVAWSVIQDRPTFNSLPLSGAMLDNVLNYPIFNQDTTGNAATATTLSGTVPWDNITNKPTIGGVEITGAVLDNSGLYPILNQNTIGNAATATIAGGLSAQYIDWSQASGATSVANRPTIGGVVVAGSVLDNASNYPIFVLGTNTSGDYVANATTDGFLEKTGTAGATLGLSTACALNEIPKWNGTAWTCATDAAGAGGTNPTFDNVQSGTNTSSTLTVGTGGTLTFSGSGIVNASQYHSVTAIDNNEFYYLDGVTSNLQGQLDNVLVFGSDARGDLVVRGVSTYGRLGIGSVGKVLGSNGTDPAWSAYTLAAPGAVGAVLYSDGTNWTRSAAPAISAANMTSFPTLNQNTAGTAANLSGTPALPNGTTATTQNANDNSTKLSTTAYTDRKAPIASPTFTGTVVLPSTTSIGNVSATELGYVDGVTSGVQSQLDTKQMADTDLSVLSFPTAWRLFYSNGSSAITELALGASGTYLTSQGALSAPVFAALDADLLTLATPTAWRLYYSGASGYSALAFGDVDLCLKSGGISSAPTWGACGTGGGGTTTSLPWDNITGTPTTIVGYGITDAMVSDNVAITGGTIDNTAIGSTTPAAGAFYTLERGSVSDTEFSYLDGLTGAIQGQLDGKQALDNGTFTDEVTASQFNSTGTDNTHYINVANTGAPNSGTETVGDCYYDNTTTAWLCWDGNSWEPPAFATISHGANPTIDGEGKIGIDNTADQLVYYGGAARVLTYQQMEPIVIKGYSAADDNVVEWMTKVPITLTSLDCRTGGADNVTVTLYECDSNAANCSTTGLVSAATSTNVNDSTATNGDIDANDRIVVSLSSIVGTPTKVSCTVGYAITRQ